ncbi:DUF6975 family protein [Sphingomonas jeddahensis]|uniref:Uncharacterized protein n=1 Tax=Sphingomonas jeddahensis TaxID=1915074 RepID=A0A1V2EX77_9SPHN|nr:hypothetical protein [Sphingomonas jeddahensis]ONF97200.1 hypothetical protein SPHI_06370 [Sphingomonas jeddahensis]
MAPIAENVAAGRLIDGLVVDQGTASSEHARALCAGDAATRDLSDAIHAFCALHGTSPSIVDSASYAPGADTLGPWLRQAAAGLDQERQSLASLTAAIGPMPSTPRHAEAEAAITAQRHALATLATSARSGCAIGAALALLLDWHAIRNVLAAAAYRSGVVLLPSDIPAPAAITAAARMIAAQPSPARALAFGAEQLILQHRGLWQLLHARAQARDAL